MYNIDFALLNTQIESIKNTADSKERNITLLSVVRYLMDNVEYSTESLAEYDDFEIKKLFSSYRKATEGACEFYETAKPVLDPEEAKGKIIQKLAETTVELDRIGQLIEVNEKNEAELLGKRAKLEELQAKYDELSDLIARLKETEKTINPDVIEEMHNTAIQKEKEIGERKEIIESLEVQINEYDKILVDLESSYTEIHTENRQIETNIIDKIQSHYAEISQVYDDNDMELSQITDKINKSLSDFETLLQEIESSKNTLKNYELHLGENSILVQAMMVNGIESVAEFNDSTESIKASVEQNLKQYDRMIKSVVTKAEDTRNEIKRLQNKR